MQGCYSGCESDRLHWFASNYLALAIMAQFTKELTWAYKWIRTVVACGPLFIPSLKSPKANSGVRPPSGPQFDYDMSNGQLIGYQNPSSVVS